MTKKCWKCGSSNLEYERDMLEGSEKYADCYRHLQNRKVYKCRNCQVINDFEEPDC
jgi:hypothetical protein